MFEHSNTLLIYCVAVELIDCSLRLFGFKFDFEPASRSEQDENETFMTKDQIKQIVVAAAQKYGINPAIALAQIQAESNFNPNARSSAGAQGLAQFMPGTARQYGLKNPFDPAQSMEAWGKYMSYLLKKFNFDYRLALAGYNAGEGNVTKYKGVPPFKETQNYVSKIMSNAGLNGGVTNQQQPDAQNQNQQTPEKNDAGKKPSALKPELLLIGLVILVLIMRD